jgi:hypothetical protein
VLERFPSDTLRRGPYRPVVVAPALRGRSRRMKKPGWTGAKSS